MSRRFEIVLAGDYGFILLSFEDHICWFLPERSRGERFEPGRPGRWDQHFFTSDRFGGNSLGRFVLKENVQVYGKGVSGT